MTKYVYDKKVLLRERKRHTAHHVVTTPSVVLTGYPPILTWPGGGTLPRYPPIRVPTPPGRVPPWQGTPQQGTPLAGYPPAGYPPSRVPPPPAGPGRVPPPPQLDLAGYPPRCLPHGILGNVAKHYGIWVPPPVDRQMDGRTDACQNITFPSYYVRGR